MRRGEKPTAPPPIRGRLWRAVFNRAIDVANEASKQLLELGRHRPLAELTRRAIDFQAAMDSFRAYEKAEEEKKSGR